MVVAGYNWKRADEGWKTTFDRITVRTWPFGSIHQCKVFVQYNGEEVGIGLRPSERRDDAMEHGVSWAKDYLVQGPQSVEQVLYSCFHNWKSIYQTRIDVIDHIFFVCGNGYEWLDGAIICAGPEDHLDLEEDANEKALPPGPLPDLGDVQRFYPVSNSSLITCVPDDVRDDWLAFAWEAAQVLRDRSGIPTIEKDELTPEQKKRARIRIAELLGDTSKQIEKAEAEAEAENKKRRENDQREQKENTELGASICKELQKRFGDRIK